ncbi:alpha/beta hydrolase [Streptomyces sp. AS58]|uniref:Alpha/beta hydrolase n=1 Tax=Streptomyces cadmiisoli TaxID=2184053 RepID=A0A2Z4JDT4_9ACTN|nr:MULTISPECIES: alpha/beta hydrolase [Streptomyces]AWW43226.1 alpha/beta hydrolase [Streptomyces cadmiisoli]KOV51050.1 alpha/beta hydrolase [Streptomyces sp. AS58]
MHIPGLPAGRRRSAAAIAVVTCSLALAWPDPIAAGGGPTPPLPVPKLDWKPCVQGSPYDCATAKVPLDYDEPGGRTIDLAVIKRKATDPGRRIGTLFFNPGGPGGPGTIQMPQNYDRFPQQVRERFDIVSWDTRGVGSSTAVDCFGSAREAAAWNESKPAGIPVGAGERATWKTAYEDLARRCEKRDPELLRHVATADTARDLDQLRRAVGEPRLTYRGLSYGTFLGATYANLFPDKVRAMVLDSNWDPTAWTNNASDDARLPTFLRLGSDRSAAATLDSFLALCGSAGTERCAFSAGSPAATRDKFDRLMARLREHPVDTWTYGRTVDDLVNGLYVVRPRWTDLAGRLQELWRGRAPQPTTPPPPPPVPHPNPYLGEEQPTAISCADSPNPRDLDAYHRAEEAAAARAGDVGRLWTWATYGCAAWPELAADPYLGPWNKPTAHPVLVIGTTLDPATPYTGAQAMARELGSARLLTNVGYGHTELLNPSGCVAAHETRYLIDGTLPPPGTECRQDGTPFAAPDPRGAVDAGVGTTAHLDSLRPAPFR